MNQKFVSHVENIPVAAEYLKSRLPSIPETALILGSGLGPLAKRLADPTIVDYKDIPGFIASTVPGHEGKLIHGKIDGRTILAMQGRSHFYEGHEAIDTIFSVRVFSALGVKNLFVTNAAGGINRSFSEGALMLITDQIALFANSPLRGPNIDEIGPRFSDMTYAYAPEFFEIARKASADTGIKLYEGVYAYTKGPQFETPAEIRALASMGADAVGMSTVAEVIAAVHCGMKVIGISCITNMAAGIIDKPLCHEEVLQNSQRISDDFCTLVSKIVVSL